MNDRMNASQSVQTASSQEFSRRLNYAEGSNLIWEQISERNFRINNGTEALLV